MSATIRPGALDGGQNLAQRGDVAAGKDVFFDERVGDARAVRAADGMQQGHAVVLQQLESWSKNSW